MGASGDVFHLEDLPLGGGDHTAAAVPTGGDAGDVGGVAPIGGLQGEAVDPPVDAQHPDGAIHGGLQTI